MMHPGHGMDIFQLLVGHISLIGTGESIFICRYVYMVYVMDVADISSVYNPGDACFGGSGLGLRRAERNIRTDHMKTCRFTPSKTAAMPIPTQLHSGYGNWDVG